MIYNFNFFSFDMYSSNLSKLVTHNYFFQILEQESISFDRIISDKNIQTKYKHFLFLDCPLKTLLLRKQIKATDRILLILDQGTLSLIFDDIQVLENLVIVNAYDGIASIAYKVSPELESCMKLFKSGFECYFPFDQNQFFDQLSRGGKKYFSLINQEIADNIYSINESQGFSFIDKVLAEKPSLITLIHNPLAEVHIIMMGNYFEEAVKLSQYLLEAKSTYHFSLVGQFSVLADDQLKLLSKKAKKLIVIIDQKRSLFLQSFLSNMLGVEESVISLLTPEYDLMKTILPDYELSECKFDSENLYQRIV